jgi:hypothetical protein
MYGDISVVTVVPHDSDLIAGDPAPLGIAGNPTVIAVVSIPLLASLGTEFLLRSPLSFLSRSYRDRCCPLTTARLCRSPLFLAQASFYHSAITLSLVTLTISNRDGNHIGIVVAPTMAILPGSLLSLPKAILTGSPLSSPCCSIVSLATAILTELPFSFPTAILCRLPDTTASLVAH